MERPNSGGGWLGIRPWRARWWSSGDEKRRRAGGSAPWISSMRPLGLSGECRDESSTTGGTRFCSGSAATTAGCGAWLDRRARRAAVHSCAR